VPVLVVGGVALAAMNYVAGQKLVRKSRLL
jgi:hypothetical protein